jgi:hypothetical protein
VLAPETDVTGGPGETGGWLIVRFGGTGGGGGSVALERRGS